MRRVYDPFLKAYVTIDNLERIRGIKLLDEYPEFKCFGSQEAAASYIRNIAGRLNIAPEELDNIEQPLSWLNPSEQKVEYRFNEEKSLFDSTTCVYYQTCLNTPVWGAGITATIKHAPSRIVSVTNTSEYNVKAKMPSLKAIRRYLRIFATAERAGSQTSDYSRKGHHAVKDGHDENLLAAILEKNVKDLQKLNQWKSDPRLIRGRFFIYRYVPEKRVCDQPLDMGCGYILKNGTVLPAGQILSNGQPLLTLQPVPGSVCRGIWFLVAEVIFRLPYGDKQMNWRMLVDVETDTTLYLRALCSNVNGLVFNYDPVTKTGISTNTSDRNNAILNPLRDDVSLANLDPPSANIQSLQGKWAAIINKSYPDIDPPTCPAGTDFDYDVRTNEFAAVNAYYHVDRFFRLVSSLGFPLTGVGGYFDGTTFPLKVDHRGLANTVNAQCVGDGDGIEYVYLGLADTTDTVNPIGIATDWRVMLHELGGHGIIQDHIGVDNFGFAHSAGDSFAMILNDYTSEWHNGAQIDRFIFMPFVPSIIRRSDRGAAEWSVAGIYLTNFGTGYTSPPQVTISGGGGTGATAIVPDSEIYGGAVGNVKITNPGTGYTSVPSVTFSGGGGSGVVAVAVIGTWGWDGGMDQGGYLSEQILSTTMFRAYQSIGGDSTSVTRREFAAHYLTYLMLRAVGMLNPTNNPDSPAQFLDALLTADALNWTFAGIYGGAYGKVLTWAFEKQNLNNGAPPEVDVYIDDGRAGEYDYIAVHWATTAIWNRHNPDNTEGHQQPLSGKTNYAYVKIKNRGTSEAHNIIVKAYHCKPAAGILWPNDLQSMSTAQLPPGTLLPDNAEVKTIGPFEWTPVANAWGHDCMMMIVSATGDPSNIDSFIAGEAIEDWRLVPNDNNVAQRNVILVPGGGGSKGLIAGMQDKGFWVGNPGRTTAKIGVSVKLPLLLESRGWQIRLRNLPENGLPLKSLEQRFISFDIKAGRSFRGSDVIKAEDRDIVITATNDGAIIGGIIYRIDPGIRMPCNKSSIPIKSCFV